MILQVKTTKIPQKSPNGHNYEPVFTTFLHGMSRCMGAAMFSSVNIHPKEHPPLPNIHNILKTPQPHRCIHPKEHPPPLSKPYIYYIYTNNTHLKNPPTHIRSPSSTHPHPPQPSPDATDHFQSSNDFVVVAIQSADPANDTVAGRFAQHLYHGAHHKVRVRGHRRWRGASGALFAVTGIPLDRFWTMNSTVDGACIQSVVSSNHLFKSQH